MWPLLWRLAVYGVLGYAMYGPVYRFIESLHSMEQQTPNHPSVSMASDPDPTPRRRRRRSSSSDTIEQLWRRLEEVEEQQQQRQCSICTNKPKEVAYMCGHQVCRECDSKLGQRALCPFCRQRITYRIRLYNE